MESSNTVDSAVSASTIQDKINAQTVAQSEAEVLTNEATDKATSLMSEVSSFEKELEDIGEKFGVPDERLRLGGKKGGGATNRVHNTEIQKLEARKSLLEGRRSEAVDAVEEAKAAAAGHNDDASAAEVKQAELEELRNFYEIDQMLNDVNKELEPLLDKATNAANNASSNGFRSR